MDGVLVQPESSWMVVHEALGTHNHDHYELYMAGRIDDMEFIRADVARWIRARPDLKLRHILDILQKVPLQRGFHATMEHLEDRGIARAMISGGLMPLARRVAREGGLYPVLANDVVARPDGSLTGEGVVNVRVREKGSYVHGILRDLGLDDGGGEVVAVGDSPVDLHMFRRCDRAIAFNPKDEAVRRGADAVVEGDDLRGILRHIR